MKIYDKPLRDEEMVTQGKRVIGIEFEETQGHVTLRKGEVRYYFTFQNGGKVIVTISDWVNDESRAFETTVDEIIKWLGGEKYAQDLEQLL